MARRQSSGKSNPSTPSRKKKVDKEELLLNERINSNKLHYSKTSLVMVALLVSFQPVYYAHAVNGVEWTDRINAAMFLVVSLATTYMLSQAYTVLIESEFWRRQRHYTEVKTKDESSLRDLRLQSAMGYALFFVNGCFFIMATALQSYLFRHTDARARYILAPLGSSSVLWFIAQKNEESRRRRMTQHK